MSLANPHERKTDALKGPPCTNVRITQLRGEQRCVRPLGHYALHLDDEGDTWF